MKIEFTETAVASLDAIRDFTIAEWGQAAAERYIGSMLSAIRKLALFPEQVPELEIGGQRYRRMQHQSHVVFYRAEAERILVLAVLRVRQDPFRHFSEP